MRAMLEWLMPARAIAATGLVPVVHASPRWIAGTGPAMTTERIVVLH